MLQYVGVVHAGQSR